MPACWKTLRLPRLPGRVHAQYFFRYLNVVVDFRLWSPPDWFNFHGRDVGAKYLVRIFILRGVTGKFVIILELNMLVNSVLRGISLIPGRGALPWPLHTPLGQFFCDSPPPCWWAGCHGTRCCGDIIRLPTRWRLPTFPSTSYWSSSCLCCRRQLGTSW